MTIWEKLEGWRTFLISFIVLVGSFWGLKEGWFPLDFAKELIWAALGVYGVKSIGRDFSTAWKERAVAAQPSKPTTAGLPDPHSQVAKDNPT